MAKKTQRKRPTSKQREKATSFKLTDAQQFGLCFLLIAVLVLAYFYPIVFEGKQPPASDTMAWRGNAQSIIESREAGQSNPLWANNVFAGMPGYLISLRAPFEQPAAALLRVLKSVIDWRALAYFIGALGMLLLMRFFGVSNTAAFMATVAFIGWPHLPGLMEAGHNSKIHTIMFMPLILWSFLSVLRNPGLLMAALFAICFSLGIQAGHFQIMFYLIVMLVIFGVAHVIRSVKAGQWQGLKTRAVFMGGALILAVGIASFPVLLVQEYTAYSIRGGSGDSAQDSGGADYTYATSWSLHPAELMTLVIPRFYGGDSAELYEGDAVPELRGQTIPGYWGHKPFTSSTDYLGVVPLILAALALGFLWRESSVRLLMITIVLSLFVAFGKHLSLVYDLFYNFVPFFNKFRVPSMILILVHFSVAILAGMGFEFILKQAKEKVSSQTLHKGLLIILAFFVVIGIVPFLFKSSFSLARPEDSARLQANVLSLVKDARYDLMKQDAFRMLLFVLATFATLFAFVAGKLSRVVLIGGIGFLLLIDLGGISKRYLQTLVKPQQIERRFAATAVDTFLLQDSTHYRIFPLGRLYGDSRWSYRHQSIGGYHPAKLRLIQDLNESVLYRGQAPGFQNQGGLPINWNMVNMLNTKYVLAQGTIQHPNLKQVLVDERNRIVVYENSACLPRVFPIGNIEVIADKQARLARLNDPSFKPDSLAILEKDLTVQVTSPGSWQSKITRYEPNVIEIDVETDTQTLMVLSEMYYPAGWKAYVDGQQTEILKTNHALRSIVVPEGRHHIVFRLRPATYVASLWGMGVASAIAYLVLLVSAIGYFRNRRS